ncbi:MAG TPA: histidine phosphatase family protein [Candidatus Moranbacteria bacterium]|nr:histidine phosphatase family protein [Candidatus Moranbacteria bacterium]
MEGITLEGGESKRKDEAKVFRHSIAEYKLDEGIVKSKKPEDKPRSDDQWFYRDLTLEGRELARKKAEEYFGTLNPETDALFFVSSDFVRAAETARIFMDVAKEKGFEIIWPWEKDKIEHDHFDNKAEEIGEGYIRKIDCLTLDHLENMLREKIFDPKKNYLKDVVKYPDNVSEDTRAKWDKARTIIENDNKGSWGDNYYAHSEEISKIFSDVKSAEEVYKTKFKRMLRLRKFAQKKILEQNPKKNIKILGFSHENSFIYFLNEEFGESIKNCESVGFRMEEDEKQSEKTKEKPIEIIVEAKGEERRFVETQPTKWEMQKDENSNIGASM